MRVILSAEEKAELGWVSNRSYWLTRSEEYGDPEGQYVNLSESAESSGGETAKFAFEQDAEVVLSLLQALQEALET